MHYNEAAREREKSTQRTGGFFHVELRCSCDNCAVVPLVFSLSNGNGNIDINKQKNEEAATNGCNE